MGGTRVEVDADISLAGSIAQFGRKGEPFAGRPYSY